MPTCTADPLLQILRSHICTFCAVRLHYGSSYLAAKSQKRTLQSSTTRRKPGATAEARTGNADVDGEGPPISLYGSWNPQSHERQRKNISPLPTYGDSKSAQDLRSKRVYRPSCFRMNRNPEDGNESEGKPLHGTGEGSLRKEFPDQRPIRRGGPGQRKFGLRSPEYYVEKAERIQKRLDGGNGFYRPDWACKYCGVQNFTRESQCRRCAWPRPELRQWLCQECKTINLPESRSCVHCHPQKHTPSSPQQQKKERIPREISLRKEGYVPPGYNMPRPEPQAWRCPKCSNMNDAEKIECVYCFALSQSSEETAQDPIFDPVSKSQVNGVDPKIFEEARAAEAARMERRRETEEGRFAMSRKTGRDSEANQTASWRPLHGSVVEDQGFEPPIENDYAEAAVSDIAHKPDASVTFDPSLLEEPVKDEPEAKKQFFARERRGVQETPQRRHKPRRQVGRSALSEGEDDVVAEDDEEAAARAERRERKKREQEAQRRATGPTPIHLPNFISVTNLAGLLKVRVESFLGKMKELGFDDLNHDHVLDAETAGLIAAEFNFEAVPDRQEEVDLEPRPPSVDKSILLTRPPVVTIMGHVDHGKTTMLDYLRKSSVAASEHGGITQHIGAFSVSMPGGRLVTFLDTPGHEAFLAMRQRGANVTDIVILVVAADDSVKPQTIEAIKHAQGAKVPMIVAINKVDKPDADVERVKQDLSRYGVEIEDFGGDTQTVCVSGKTGQGMQELEDAAVALADILDLRAEKDGPAEGWVLEATTSKAGRVATVLVRRGTLRPGDVIVAGTSWARVRSLRNEAGALITEAGPGTPVEIHGWRAEPSAGDEMLQASDEQRAREVVDHRLAAIGRTQLAVDMATVNEARRIEQEKREAEKAISTSTSLLTGADATNDPPANDAEENKLQTVHLLLKADVSGSLEAVSATILSLSTPLIRPLILRSSVGSINESDIEHASASGSTIITFNVPIGAQSRRQADAAGVRIVEESIIYRLVDSVKALMEERLPQRVSSRVTGEAEVAQIFEIQVKAPGGGKERVKVAGCKVRNGVIARGKRLKVWRGVDVVFDGTLSSLKNVKKDVTEMRKGSECGMGFEGWEDFQVGDQVQSYEEIVEKRTS